MRERFSFKDFIRECSIEESCYRLHYKSGYRNLGARVSVPRELFNTAPFNRSAYDFLQFFREEIFEFGLIEFPDLPVNLSNYTVAMRSPLEHSYSANPYLTEPCQSPHQDTPPYPTAFWLGEERKLSATWVMTDLAVEAFTEAQRSRNYASIEEIHKALVPKSLEQQSSILLNYRPGLLLIDNSEHHQLYHAKTCRFNNKEFLQDLNHDTPMYTFNEVGLLNYMDSLDEQRGFAHRDQQEAKWVREFNSSKQSDG
ncbi:MAG: hypothetical protein MI867_17525 [Pseudomonadales bacterium]|nr:hypothetical protein [Pseudomonadales bacterium]